MAFCLSITGVAFCEFEHSQVVIWRGGILLGKAFCQKILPVSASIANTVSSLPTTKTRVFRPWEVFTPSATSGEVRVDRTSSLGGVLSCVLHFSSSLETLSLERVVSARFQPVRS